ncbi:MULTISPECIES: sulfite exporter TauE/SafE family protein [Rhizobium/Agrobacterium group]|uniref:sulfite exporter TauE/SafE family protein n=1 Tax=Rhizobium/Agrobacterium group TaxID=227290 RepID=UPI001AD961B7|nr:MULTISPECIES: sulfite exporter TauE/SafE family protein [Rhizobium/Agrobacterium group]MBO9112650.1 sulfite exporter TauE/SafE family protein [Agrobacterium sp. S2/73]QXZ76144.1 sulfite exporter TauE/SafE family protein [Agrobacterium sp. S7/73]QYA17308.1 sulfite exporter TauE/SafE family protein [Rhizobium sp. AB2/73]UEQ85575.1 sulfite exporter TauE/SafE family protein [Rhizobium sp. AB2/73]
MHPDLWFFVVATIAIIILGLSKGGFAGIGMISTPMLALVMGPLEAASFMLPVMLSQDAIAVLMYRRIYNRKSLAVLLPGAVLGVIAAYLLASSVAEWVVELVLGVVSLAFALWQLLTTWRGAPIKADSKGNSTLGIACGAGAGFTSTIAHAGSPPFQFYAMPLRLSRDEYVGTSVYFFAILNVMKLPVFFSLGQFNTAELPLIAMFIPIAMVSSWVGGKLVRYVSPEKFNMLIIILLIGVSFALIFQGLMG